MMGHLKPVIAAVLILGALGTAWGQAGITAATKGAAEPPPPEASALWAHITQVSPYKGWQAWPATDTPAPRPHGPLGRTFVNETAASSLKKGGPLACGSIIVREGWSLKRERLLNVALMYKVAGYHPAGGDWFWLLTSPEAAAQGLYTAQGRVGTCLACHVGQGDNDFVLGRRLKSRK